MRSVVGAVIFICLLGAHLPAQAFWGVLGSIGRGAGKVAKVAPKPKPMPVLSTSGKIGTAAGATGMSESAMAISKASGLGKAVPDDIAAMMRLPARKLEDIPDAGTRSWLTPPPNAQAPNDAIFMMRDYNRIIKGRPALGPQQKSLPLDKIPTPAFESDDPEKIEKISWYAMELLLRAAHLGNDRAILERKRLCLDHKAPSALKNLPDCRI